jgi:HEAT repeat protein
MRSDDIRARRFAFQLAAELRAPVLSDELVGGLEDPDPLVRLAAVGALDASTPPGREALLRMIDDADSTVSAAASARSVGLGDASATTRLDELLDDADARVRQEALEQLDAAPAPLAADLAQRSLADPDPQVRAAALDRLAAAAPDRALAPAVARIDDSDRVVRLAAGRALGAVGPMAIEHVLAALRDPATSDVGIEAARRIELDGETEAVRAFVRAAAERARRDRVFIAAIPEDSGLEALLRAAVVDRALVGARTGLWAASMLANESEAIHTAIERLDGSGPVRASALETLEAADTTELIGPLVALWEPIGTPRDQEGSWLTEALADEDELVRRCAAAVRAQHEGDAMTRSQTTVSVIERVLILRGIPLFADLSPADLERLALIAEEQDFDDGATIAREGDLGEDMYVVTDGVIRVVSDLGRNGGQLARRTAGDVVGEMSIITRNPRVASLVADGPVRTIRIGHREFESMVRERPDLALGVMRVLALRLAESAHPTSGQ